MERIYIKKYGLGYSELQNMPMRILRIWDEAEIKEMKRKQFELLKRQNARTNN